MKYKGVVKNLSDYCSGVLKVEQFDIDFIKGYEIHLRDNLNNHTNTISSNLSCLRALSNSLIEDGVIKVDKYPF